MLHQPQVLLLKPGLLFLLLLFFCKHKNVEMYLKKYGKGETFEASLEKYLEGFNRK